MIKVELDSLRDNQYNKKLLMWAESRTELGIGFGDDLDWIAIPVEAVKLAIEAIQLDFIIYDALEVPEEKNEK